jgi:hypothetical protein
MGFIEIELPDGTIIEVPEGTSQEEIMSAISQYQEQANPQSVEQAPVQDTVVESPQTPVQDSFAVPATPTAEEPVQAPVPAPIQPPTEFPSDPYSSMAQSADYQREMERQQVVDQQPSEDVRRLLDNPDGPLPDFNNSMYVGLTPAEREELFARYRDDPDTIGLPSVMYTNVVPPIVRMGVPPLMRRDEQGRLRTIPRPGGGLPFGSGANVLDLAQQSVPSAVGNVLQFPAAGLDAIGLTNDAVGAIDRNIPRPEYGDNAGLDQFFVETLPMVASGTVVGSALWNGLKNAPLAMRSLATYVGSSVATDIVAPEGSGGIAIGDKALLEPIMPDILRGLQIDDPDRAEEIIQDRVNLLADGLAAGGIAGKAVQLTGFAGKLIYDATLRRAVNATMRLERSVEERKADEVLDALVKASNPRANAQERELARSDLIRIIEENSELFEEGVRRVPAPDMNNPGATVGVELDTLGVIMRGLDPEDPAQRSMYVAAEELRRGYLLRSGNSNTRIAAQGPQSELNRQIGEYETVVGGNTVTERTGRINDATEGFVDQARADLQPNVDAIAARRTELNDLQDPANFLSSLDDNLELSDTVDRLARATGTEISAISGTNIRQVEGQVRSSLETLSARKNAAYNEISGGPIDVEAMYDALATADLDSITRAGTTLPLKPELRNLVRLFQPDEVPVGGSSAATDMLPFNPSTAGGPPNQSATRLETRKEVIKRMEDWFALEPEKYNYGFFHNQVRPELSQLASDLYRGTGSERAQSRVVRGIIDTIDNRMLEYVGRTDPAMIGQVENARSIYQNDYAPFFKDGPLEDYARIYVETRAGIGPDARVLQPTNFEGESLDLLQNVLSQRTEGAGVRVDQIRRLMETPEGGANSEALFDYLAVDVLSGMISDIRTAGIQGISPEQLNRVLSEKGAVLNRAFPERASYFNEFVDSFSRQRGAIDSTEEALRLAEETLLSTKDRIVNGELRSFFMDPNLSGLSDEVLATLRPTADGYAAFKQVFSGPDALDRTNSIMARIDRAPEGQREVLLDGMKTAYARMLQDNGGIITRTPLMADETAASQARITGALSGQNNLFALGRIIHKDTPEVMDALEGLSSLAASDLRARSGTPNPGQSPTAFSQEILKDTERSVRWFVGALSRTATQIRTAISTGLERLDITNISASVADNIASNPEAFVQAHRRLLSNPSDPAIVEMYYRVLTRGMVVQDRDDVMNAIVGAMVEGEMASRGREEDETERMLVEEAAPPSGPLRFTVTPESNDIEGEMLRQLR